MGKTLAYIRVSTVQQDVSNQRLEILEYARRHEMQVADYIEVEMSSRRDRASRRIDELLGRMERGDTIIVSELSRLGRSTVEVVELVNELVATGIGLVCIKQGLRIASNLDKMDMQSKVTITMFSLFAELERDLLSERTKQALASKRSQGVKLGKPRGTIQRSKLDDRKDAISELLKHRVSKSAVARMMGVSRTALASYVDSRGL
jgi:DNA invertase Pin-like site-specific DNA recombinase